MRCDICDSTEFDNKLETAITSWVRLEDGGDRCNVCNLSYLENSYDLSLEDEVEEDDHENRLPVVG